MQPRPGNKRQVKLSGSLGPQPNETEDGHPKENLSCRETASPRTRGGGWEDPRIADIDTLPKHLSQ